MPQSMAAVPSVVGMRPGIQQPAEALLAVTAMAQCSSHEARHPAACGGTAGGLQAPPAVHTPAHPAS